MTNLDTLIRDLTKVHPLSKSEVRQRLEAFEVGVRIEELKSLDREIFSDAGAMGISGVAKLLEKSIAALQASLGGGDD
jgi:hypothetical protein